MRIIICEDERPALDRLIKLIDSSVREAEIVATCETGEEAVSAISELKPDLIFLDIELADGPCFYSFAEIGVDFPVVFTTAYEEYALKAFKLNCVDYLLKPISEEAIHRSINKYKSMKHVFGSLADKDLAFIEDQPFEETISQKEKSTLSQRLAVKINGTIKFIKVSEILWIESDGNYIEINTQKGKFLYRSTLKGILENLDNGCFYRIHKSILVNIEYIDFLEESGVGDFVITLVNGSKLRMSRNYKEILKVL